MKKGTIKTKRGPKAIGPYSQAIRAGNFVFCSGQIAIDPKRGNLVKEGITAQTKQVLENLKVILEAGGTSLEKVVKTTVYLKRMSDFPKMNQVYSQYFKNNPPSRTTIAVGSLPKGALVEIEAIAII